jgi:hypothetical protein
MNTEKNYKPSGSEKGDVESITFDTSLFSITAKT